MRRHAHGSGWGSTLLQINPVKQPANLVACR